MNASVPGLAKLSEAISIVQSTATAHKADNGFNICFPLGKWPKTLDYGQRTPSAYHRRHMMYPAVLIAESSSGTRRSYTFGKWDEYLVGKIQNARQSLATISVGPRQLGIPPAMPDESNYLKLPLARL